MESAVSSSFYAGIALIMEGDTEYYFYEHIIRFICNNNSINFSKIPDEDGLFYRYELSKGTKTLVVKIKNAESITQVTTQYLWFKNFCASKHAECPWEVFLCYDTDGQSISVFSQSDWDKLKQDITSLPNVKQIVDCAAKNDIEDIMLIDFNGILKYLGIYHLRKTIVLKGRKGKSKMKKLFQEANRTYHEGKRALPLIEALNLKKIIRNANNNIVRIQQTILSYLK